MLTLTLRTLQVGKRNEPRDMILFFLVLSSLKMKRESKSLLSEDLNLLSKNEGEIRISDLTQRKPETGERVFYVGNRGKNEIER